MALIQFTQNDPPPPAADSYFYKWQSITTTVNNIDTEVTTARGGETDLNTRLNNFSTTFATQTWTIDEIEARITLGGSPGDIGITNLGVGALNNGEIVIRDGSSLVGINLYSPFEIMGGL